ncbi:hypothetical protein [Pseudarthrobacter sp. AL20]
MGGHQADLGRRRHRLNPSQNRQPLQARLRKLLQRICIADTVSAIRTE